MLLIPGKDPRGDALLCAAIREEIGTAGGAIPFARFMELCLQHPTRGYYRRGRTRAGHGGDFLTSAEAHPAFAGVVARQLAVFAEVLAGADARGGGDSAGRAPVFVEAGAGTGTMANLVASSLADVGPVIAVDTAAHVHREEEGTAPLRVRAAGLPFATGAIRGAIYANELLDAFPVHRLRRAGARWRELFVGIADDGEAFRWVEAEPSASAAALADGALARGGRANEGQIVDVTPAILPWVEEAARVLDRGFVLLVDYGSDTPSLVSPEHPNGTLRCFAGHAIHDDPLRFAGTQDITASVDFGLVVEAAKRAGLEAVAFLEQRAWLDAWGVADAAAGIPALAEAGRLRLDEVETNQRAIEFLRDPRGLGRVKVLALAKGIAPQTVPGLAGEVPLARRFRADDLPLTRLFDPFAGLLE